MNTHSYLIPPEKRGFRNLVVWGSLVWVVYFGIVLLSGWAWGPSDLMVSAWFANAASGVLISKQPIRHWIWLVPIAGGAYLTGAMALNLSLAEATLQVPAHASSIVLTAVVLRSLVNHFAPRLSPHAFLLIVFLVSGVSALGSAAVTLLTGYAELNTLNAIRGLNWAIGSMVAGLVILPLLMVLLMQKPATVLANLIDLSGIAAVLAALLSVPLAVNILGEAFTTLFLALVMASLFAPTIATMLVLLVAILVAPIGLGVYSGENAAPFIGVDGSVILGMQGWLLGSVATAVVGRNYVESQRINRLTTRNRELVETYNATPIPMCVIDQRGLIVSANEAWLLLFGYPLEDLILQEPSVFFADWDRQESGQSLLAGDKALMNCSDVPMEMLASDGRLIHALVSTLHFHDTNAASDRTLIIAKDRTNEMELARQLVHEKETLEVTLRSIGDGVITTDANGKISFLNEAAETILKVPHKIAKGALFSEVFAIVDYYSGRPLPDPVTPALKEGVVTQLPDNAIVLTADGDELSIQDTIAPIRNPDGVIIGAVMVFQDVTGTRGIRRKMEHMAHHDPLTDLPNRYLLNDRIERACSLGERTKNPFSVLFLDLDNFKTFNDSLGHDAGDHLLVTMAQRFSTVVRTSDTVCRLGGDEFVFLVMGTPDSHDILTFVRHLQHEIRRPFTLNDVTYSVTASIGIATFPDDGVDSDSLLKHADAAMYESKRSGKDDYHYYSEALEQGALKRLRVEQSLRGHIDSNAFKVHYQPIYDTRAMSITCVEALCRWPDDSVPLIPPDVFIPIAEESKLINVLGLQILEKVCADLAEYHRIANRTMVVSVNISPIQLKEPGFADQVLELWRSYDLSADNFVFEITETAFFKDTSHNIERVERLRNLGSKIALDDFGTGYSSLAHIKHLPVDLVKVDRVFIDELDNTETGKAFVMSILEMAKALHLDVIAEGVEFEPQLDWLRAHHCDFVQGYYLSRPAPMEDMIESSTDQAG